MVGSHGRISFLHGPTSKEGGIMQNSSGTAGRVRMTSPYIGRLSQPLEGLAITGIAFLKQHKQGKLSGKRSIRTLGSGGLKKRSRLLFEPP